MIPSYPCMRCFKVVNWDSAATNQAWGGAHWGNMRGSRSKNPKIRRPLYPKIHDSSIPTTLFYVEHSIKSWGDFCRLNAGHLLFVHPDMTLG